MLRNGNGAYCTFLLVVCGCRREALPCAHIPTRALNAHNIRIDTFLLKPVRINGMPTL